MSMQSLNTWHVTDMSACTRNCEQCGLAPEQQAGRNRSGLLTFHVIRWVWVGIGNHHGSGWPKVELHMTGEAGSQARP